MSQRHANETISSEGHDDTNYAEIIFNQENEKKYHDDWAKQNDFQRTYYVYTKNGDGKDNYRNDTLADCDLPLPLPTTKKVKKGKDSKFRSPNVCVAKNELGGPVNCKCNRHFTLNVPDLRNTNNEVTTVL